ncbi:HAD family phosphatase [Embleya sp. NBC_00896]|uniref:HAD family hydrolase n=1 Tax=Embleya sp. NBC_00896 TaxID=2975961 RepID=UPI002F90D5BB|nr:HAD family phosphatase [Embleya sp. NBC_00896]
MEWIVFDFGGVISTSPPDAAGAALARGVGVSQEELWAAYWINREAYDAGAIDAAGFWADLCARLDRPAPDGRRLDALMADDLAAWMHVDQGTVDLLAELAEQDVPLALLSNAPSGMARLIEEQPWSAVFRHRLFSADLGLTKPDPRIFGRLCERLDARPGDLLFVDDRPENLDAARALGIESVLFTDALGLRAELGRTRVGGSLR